VNGPRNSTAQTSLADYGARIVFIFATCLVLHAFTTRLFFRASDLVSSAPDAVSLYNPIQTPPIPPSVPLGIGLSHGQPLHSLPHSPPQSPLADGTSGGRMGAAIGAASVPPPLVTTQLGNELRRRDLPGTREAKEAVVVSSEQPRPASAGGGSPNQQTAQRPHRYRSKQEKALAQAELELYGPATSPFVARGDPVQPSEALPLPVDLAAGKYRGLFRCDVHTGCPTYAAAFLTSRRQLLSRDLRQQLTKTQTNMEAASYQTFGGHGVSAIWTTIDALDFSVEHISMYERVLRSVGMPASPIKDALLGEFGRRLHNIERDTRRRCLGYRDRSRQSPEQRRAAVQTVAVMPFYAAGAGSGHSIRETKLRYLNITVYSILCHFDSVVVAVSHDSDEEYVRHQSGLPIFDVIRLRDLPKPSSTGVFTVHQIQQRLQYDPRWSRFEHVFYTEADQILHLRTSKVFLPLLERNAMAPENAGRRRPNAIRPAIVVPHRFHNVPSAGDFRAVDAVHNNSRVYKLLSDAKNPRKALEALGENLDPNAIELYDPNLGRPSVRRELELYENIQTTHFEDLGEDHSCCFIPGGQSQIKYHNDPALRAKVQDPDTEAFSIRGGFRMVAGDCCFICTWRNRYCHSRCTPRRAGEDGRNCGSGAFRKG